jgi:hypothetical protein
VLESARADSTTLKIPKAGRFAAGAKLDVSALGLWLPSGITPLNDLAPCGVL